MITEAEKLIAPNVRTLVAKEAFRWRPGMVTTCGRAGVPAGPGCRRRILEAHRDPDGVRWAGAWVFDLEVGAGDFDPDWLPDLTDEGTALLLVELAVEAHGLTGYRLAVGPRSVVLDLQEVGDQGMQTVHRFRSASLGNVVCGALLAAPE